MKTAMETSKNTKTIILIDCELYLEHDLLSEKFVDLHVFPQQTEPYGLLALAGYLRDHNSNCRVVVMRLPLGEGDWYLIRQADIVGFSVLSYQWDWFFELLKAVKKENPQALLIAGREHPTALPELHLNTLPELDLVVCGEGELPLSELATGKDPPTIAGLAYRAADGKVVINERPPRLKEWSWAVRDTRWMRPRTLELGDSKGQ